MNLALFTNTYAPFIGGVARSVQTLENECRTRGHEVAVVAPEFDGAAPAGHVLRVPAIQDFNGSGFCVRIPLPNLVRDFIDDFCPDLIHSHHPFLLGDAALREAWKMRVPLVFTHHTLYEQYTHYLPLDSPALRRAAIQLDTEYCNLCDRIIAPSGSVRELLVSRGVETPVEVIPTGICLDDFASGDRARGREKHGIPADAKVVGHVGRLANEKNLPFLAEAVIDALRQRDDAVFLLVGDGDAREAVETTLRDALGERVFVVGGQSGQDLFDAYAAMDLFAFSSQSETQGMVLAEAMAAGLPVVALDGPGVRDIVVDGKNGRLLDAAAGSSELALAVTDFLDDPGLPTAWREAALARAEDFGTEACVEEMLACYGRAIADYEHRRSEDLGVFQRLLDGAEAEWDLMSAKLAAAAAAAVSPLVPET
ncbi:glycosyltransferase [Haloferula sargassicola]|uniref:Alpha-monoglucosyldiacylglycerol synthase n=1 Tax=Haloferula sargassicola TaxID=490096 RepID=A0ABP9UUD6_9BACT